MHLKFKVELILFPQGQTHQALSESCHALRSAVTDQAGSALAWVGLLRQLSENPLIMVKPFTNPRVARGPGSEPTLYVTLWGAREDSQQA